MAGVGAQDRPEAGPVDVASHRGSMNPFRSPRREERRCPGACFSWPPWSRPFPAAHADGPAIGRAGDERAQGKIGNQLEPSTTSANGWSRANMALDGTEAETFWPIYSRYRGETDSCTRETFQLLLEICHPAPMVPAALPTRKLRGMVDLYRGLQERQLSVLPVRAGSGRRCHLGGPCASCRSKRNWTRWRRCRSASQVPLIN